MLVVSVAPIVSLALRPTPFQRLQSYCADPSFLICSAPSPALADTVPAAHYGDGMVFQFTGIQPPH